MGVQIKTRPTWAFQDVPPEGGCFWRKQPSSPGRAGWQAPPLFSKPRRFRNVSVCDFAKIFNRSSTFFIVLRSSTGKFPKSNFSIHSMYP
ncbi:hypothetical protein GmHk_U059487 [Glycine max]|nr:hypothetical protein GmHk_U059487 [Glycine max]